MSVSPKNSGSCTSEFLSLTEMATTSEVSADSPVDHASAVSSEVDHSEIAAPLVEGSPQPVTTETSPEDLIPAPTTGVLATEKAAPPTLGSSTVSPQPNSTKVPLAFQDSTLASGVFSSGVETTPMTVSAQRVSTGNRPDNQDLSPATTALFSPTMAISSATVTPQPVASRAISSTIATPSATVLHSPVAIAVSPENQGSASIIGISSGMAAPSLPNSNPVKKRGRPMGSRNKPKMPKQNVVPQDLGNLIASSGGLYFTPHIFVVPAGKEIMGKIIALSQQEIHSISVVSATGLISSATLRRTSPYTKITYEGQFEIVALTGSLTPTNPETDDGSRLGSLTIKFAGPDGEIVGGLVGGQLIAASPVQVVIGSYTEGKQNPEPK